MTTDQVKKILLFGGTFDPIHLGHIASVQFFIEKLNIDQTILIPAASPPHKQHQTQTPFTHRHAMCLLAAKEIANCTVTDCEANRCGPSFSYDTVAEIKATLDKSTQLYWLIGADTLSWLPTWHRFKEFVDLCTIVTASRPGFHFDGTLYKSVLSVMALDQLENHIIPSPQHDISATQIRENIRKQIEINDLTLPKIATYINQNKLYL
jgi:nicotinate-nucleotide adenylyltransferase